MSPRSTLSLDGLLRKQQSLNERRMTTIAEAERGLEGTTERTVRQRLQRRITRSRRTIRDDLEHGDELEQMAFEATELQIADFNDKQRTHQNPAPWDTHMQRLHDIPDEQQRKRAWQQTPESLRRFQRCFAKPGQYVVPRSSDLPRDATDAILIDPECVPDDLAESLGIVQFDEHDSPLDRWKKKHDPAFVRGLKRILRETRPLDKRNHRVLAIPDGRIFYSSESNGSRTELKVGLYDAYGAHRKTHGEHELYERESGMLATIGVRLDEAQQLLSGWRSSTPDDAKQRIREAVLPVIAECAETLEPCVNVYKRFAGDKLEGIDDIAVIRKCDQRTIANPSAIMSKLVSVCSALNRRFNEMSSKGGYNAVDAIVIKKEIDRSRAIFSGLRNRLSQVTPETLLSAANSSHFSQLRKITVQPFLRYAEEILSVVDGELATARREENPDAMARAIVKIYVRAKRQFIRDGIEEMKGMLLGMEHLQLHDLRVFTEKLTTLFAKEQIFPGLRVEEEIAPFEDAKAKLYGTLRGLVHYERRDLPTEELQQKLRDFRKHLDSYEL